jgi:hypothetical protein
MSDSACHIELTSSNGEFFSNSLIDDIMIHPQYATQKIMIGTSNGPVSTMTITSNNVGVGIASPSYKLDVVGDINLTGTFRQNGAPYIASQWSNNSTNVFLLSSNVGIGTSTPSTALDVNGTINATAYTGDTITSLSNLGMFGSNTAVSASNTTISLSNYVYGTNTTNITTAQTTANWGSNAAVFGSNTSVSASNTTISLSNYVYGANTTNISWTSNAAVFGSNTSVASSNVAFWSSNNLFNKNTGGTINGNVTVFGNVTVSNATLECSNISIKRDNDDVLIIEVNEGSASIRNGNLGDDLRLLGACNVSLQTFTSASWNTRLHVQNNGNIGIATTSPSEVLDVVGNIKASSNVYVTSRLGVGTSNPSQPVHVVGNMRVEGNLDINGIFNTINTDVQVTDQFTVSNAGTGPALNVYQMGAQSIADFYDDSNLAMRIADGGNVGIGHSSPFRKLDVIGTARVSSESTYLAYDSSRGFNVIGTNGIMRLWRPTGDVTYELITGSNGASPGATSNYWWDFFVSYTNGSFNIRDRTTIGGNTATRLAIDLAGNVGIGTTTPAYRLDVAGTLRTQNLIYTNNQVNNCVISLFKAGTPTSTDTAYYGFGLNSSLLRYQVESGSTDHGFFADTTELMRIKGTGNVGIGTTAPSYRLDVNGNIKATTSSTTTGIIVQRDDVNTIIGNTVGTENYGSIQVMSAGSASSVGSSPYHLNLQPSGGDIYTGTGNVGIGTKTPSAKLHVSGNVQITNNANALHLTLSNNNSPFLQINGSSNSVILGVASANSAHSSDAVTGDAVLKTSPIGSTGRLLIQTGHTSSAIAINSNNNVGIGTTTPSSLLTVAGMITTIGSGTGLMLNGGGGQTNIALSNNRNAIVQLGLAYNNGEFSSDAQSNDLIVRNMATNGKILLQNNNNASALCVNSNNNVGIGTGTPLYRLDVSGNTRLNNAAIGDAGHGPTWAAFAHSNSFTTGGYALLQNNTGSTLLNCATGQSINFRINNVDQGFWNATGLGVGTTSPGYRLDVNGDINFTGSLRSNGNIVTFGGGGGSSQWTSSGANVSVGSGSNVGIRTTSPSYALDVNGTSKLGQVYNFNEDSPIGGTSTNRRFALLATLSTNNGFCRFQGIAGGHDSTSTGQGKCMFDVIVDNRNVSIRGNVENFLGNNQAGIVIYRNNTSGAFTVYLSGKDWYRHTTQVTSADSGTTVSTSLSWSSDTAWTTPAGTTLWLDTTVHIPNNSQATDFYMSSAGTPVYGITQLNTGYVGIGNSNPTYMLDVTGKQRLTGNVISQNAGPRLQINDFDGTEDSAMYAIAQITQNGAGTSTYSNQACLAFVRSGNWVTGLGFARGSNVFGIGQGQGPTANFSPSWLSITQGGNIGIGTTSPNTNLHVNHDFHITANNAAWNSTAGKGLYMRYSTNAQDSAYIQSITRSLNTYHNLIIQASNLQLGGTNDMGNATNSVYVRFDGNVGIGTASPAFRLDVVGNTRLNNATIGDSGFGNTVAVFAHSNEFNMTDFALAQSSSGETYLNCATGQPLRFRRNNVDLGVWNTSGLGIGTSSAANTLDVLGTFRVKSTTALKGSGNQLNMMSVETNDATALAFNVRVIPSATATAQGIHIHAVEPGVSDDRNLILQGDAGRIGIGTKNPSSSYKCHVGGSLLADGDVVGFSDIRLKSNIKIIDNALVKLHSINGYTFNIKADDRKHTGLIAQEVKEVLPEAVHEDKEEEGGYLSLAYGNMAGLLVEAIKEVDNNYKAKTQSLEEQVSLLQAEVLELKQLVKSLTS